MTSLARTDPSRTLVPYCGALHRLLMRNKTFRIVE